MGLVSATWPIGQLQARPGDKILVSGAVGDHGIAVTLAREVLDIETDTLSDTALLHTLAAKLLSAVGRACTV